MTEWRDIVQVVVDRFGLVKDSMDPSAVASA